MIEIEQNENVSIIVTKSLEYIGNLIYRKLAILFR